MKKRLFLSIICGLLSLGCAFSLSNNKSSKIASAEEDITVTSISFYASNHHYLQFNLSCDTDYPTSTIGGDGFANKWLESSNMGDHILINGLSNQFMTYNVFNGGGICATLINTYWVDSGNTEITSVEIKAGTEFVAYSYLRYGGTKTTYVTTKDTKFVLYCGSYLLEEDIPEPAEEIETDVSKLETGEGFIILYPTVHDYSNAAGTSWIGGPSALTERFNRLSTSTQNVWRDVLVDDSPVHCTFDEAIINVWNRKPSFAFYLKNNSGHFVPTTSITIPAGFTFPSYEYCYNGNVEARVYVVKTAVKFELHDGLFYKEGTYVEPQYINTSIKTIQTEAQWVNKGLPNEEKYTWIHMYVNGFDGIENWMNPGQNYFAFLKSFNQNTHVLVNGAQVSFQDYAFAYGHFQDSHYYSIRLTGYFPNDINNITIKSGYQLPSYEYAMNDDDPIIYQTTSDITFYPYYEDYANDVYSTCVTYFGGQEFANAINSAETLINSVDNTIYRQQEQQRLLAKQTEALAELHKLRDFVEGDQNKIQPIVDAFTAFVSTLKTDAQYTEFEEYTAAAYSELENYKQASDYSEGAWAVIQSYIAEGKSKIDEQISKANIDAVVAEYKAKIDTVVSLAGLEQFNAKIAAAKEDIKNYKSDVKYRAEEAKQRKEIVLNATNELDGEIYSEAEINQIVADAKAAIDLLKTDDDYLLEEAQVYIQKILQKLDKYMENDVDTGVYSEEVLAQIAALVEQAKVDVAAAKSVNEVDAILAKLEQDISNLPYTPTADEPIEFDDIDEPVNPVTPEEKQGCAGQLSISLILVSLISVFAVSLLLLKKKNEN